MQDVSSIVTSSGTEGPGGQIKRIRDLLRQAQVERESNNETAARELLAQSERHIDNLINGLTRRIEIAASRAFGSPQKSEMAKDAFCQIVHELLRSVRDLSAANVFLETNFNAAFKKKCLDAVRRVLSENGIKRGQSVEGGDYVLVSAELPLHTGQDDGPLVVADVIADPLAGAAFVDCTVGIALEQILSKLEGSRRDIFMLRYYRNWEWKKIAEHCGLSEKTARLYYKAVLIGILQELAPEIIGEMTKDE